MSDINQKKTDSNNGVVCWFYVYKNNDDSKPSICGIVIIKQLEIDDKSDSESSNLPSDKVFFFTETNLTYHNKATRDEYKEYTNDAFIREFIDTEPTSDAIKAFQTKKFETKYKFIIMDYTELHFFLDVAINKNF